MAKKLPAVSALFFLLLWGCTTTRNELFLAYDKMVEEENFTAAAAGIENSASEKLYGPRDQALRYLDGGILFHYAGDYRRSIESFTAAERLIEENYTRSLSQAGASFLINDYQLEYYGEDYEDIYLNVFKAIAFIEMDDLPGAFVEVRRINNKLNFLEDKYRSLILQMSNSQEARRGRALFAPRQAGLPFHNSALASYLSLLLYRAEGRWDEAAIDLRRLRGAFETQPFIYPAAPPDLSPMLQPSTGARLNFIAFTGRGPVKRAQTLRITSGENLLFITAETEDESGRLRLVGMESFFFDGIQPGYNFKCQIPRMQLRPSSLARIVVASDGAVLTELELLESLDRAAYASFAVRENLILAKTVIRAALKAITVAQSRRALEKSEDPTLRLFSLLGGLTAEVLVDASEQADLRLARYFPGQAYVGEAEVPPGEHELTINYYDHSGQLVRRETLPRQEYRDRPLNLLVSYNLR